MLFFYDNKIKVVPLFPKVVPPLRQKVKFPSSFSNLFPPFQKLFPFFKFSSSLIVLASKVLPPFPKVVPPLSPNNQIFFLLIQIFFHFIDIKSLIYK
jgi:hypothetical protein